jgi:hypothetical protein
LRASARVLIAAKPGGFAGDIAIAVAAGAG